MKLVLLCFYSTCAAAQVVTPYTVTEVSRQYDANGKLTAETRFLTAVNHDGSLVTVDLDPAAGGRRQILDAANRRELLVDPKTGTASEMRRTLPPVVPRAHCEDRFRAMAGATVTVDSSAEVINGVALDRVRVESRLPVVLEIYMAPALGCHIIKSVTREGGRILRTQSVEESR
jgi:hypothetical protein